MIFNESLDNVYSVKELSISQAQEICEPVSGDAETCVNIEQLLNHHYTYRTHLDLSSLSEAF